MLLPAPLQIDLHEIDKDKNDLRNSTSKLMVDSNQPLDAIGCVDVTFRYNSNVATSTTIICPQTFDILLP